MERVARDARRHPLLPLHAMGPAGGMTVLSTTRKPGEAEAVTKAGADHVLIDDRWAALTTRRRLGGPARS